MGGPSRVTYCNVAREVFFMKVAFKVSNLSFLFVDIQAAVKNGNAGTVVAAILKTLESFQNDIARPAMPEISNDSTHGSFWVFSSMISCRYWAVVFVDRV